MNAVFALVAGFVFGVGLLISGMTNPAKILAFLDIAGVWNPSLMFVMVGAILTAIPAFAYIRSRGKTLLGAPASLPARSPITPRLLAGSALFGIGWGLSGFCPGPAFVALTFGDQRVWIFVLAVVAGMVLAHITLKRLDSI